MSLRNRLLAVVVSLLAAAVLTVGVGLSFYSRDTVLHQAENDGQLLANVLSRSIVVSQNVESAAEDIIAKDLVTSAQIVAQFVAVAERYRMTPAAMTEHLRAMTGSSNLAEIWVTDSLGKAYLHTVPGVDFEFSADPKPQRPELNQTANRANKPVSAKAPHLRGFFHGLTWNCQGDLPLPQGLWPDRLVQSEIRILALARA